jgi:hypothetical protein
MDEKAAKAELERLNQKYKIEELPAGWSYADKFERKEDGIAAVALVRAICTKGKISPITSEEIATSLEDIFSVLSAGSKIKLENVCMAFTTSMLEKGLVSVINLDNEKTGIIPTEKFLEAVKKYEIK